MIAFDFSAKALEIKKLPLSGQLSMLRLGSLFLFVTLVEFINTTGCVD